MLRILVCNDDGYLAEGLLELKRALESFAQVYVLAPKSDRSACSSSLDTLKRLYCEEHSENHHYCDATSATCAHLGINGYFDFEPDLVVSGINRGANMGDDALYSGTLAAALEGRFLKGTSMALSLVGLGAEPKRFSTAATVAATLVRAVQTWSLPQGLVLNVNIPDLPLDEIQGWRSTRLGHRERAAPIEKGLDEGGKSYCRFGLIGNGLHDHPLAHSHIRPTMTDFAAVADGQISLTPISADMTYAESLADLDDRLKDTSAPTGAGFG